MTSLFSWHVAMLGGVLLFSVGTRAASAGGPPPASKATAFGKATKADVQQATAGAIANTKTTLTAIYNVPTAQHTFANTILPLDALNNKLSSVAGPLDILINASPDSAVHHQASFIHLTAYGAGCYSYTWSKVYAEDLFSVFEKNGLRYREYILAKGGTDEEYNLVKNFLGREPNQEAFFKSLGL